MRIQEFPERLTKYLQQRLAFLKDTYGETSEEYKALALQYIYNEAEDNHTEEVNSKHYEAGVNADGTQNVERLYQRHAVVELNFNCLANCRFCLRSNYEKFVLSEEQMDANAEYLAFIGAEEVLITGGDPFLSVKRLAIFTDKIVDKVPTMKIIRIATRVFTQDPNIIKDDIITVLAKLRERVRVEVATQINSHVELEDDEVKAAFAKILKLGIPVYSQNVFLKGVNDTPEQLIKLYHSMRCIGIEAHYLFHSIPMKGTHHLRPTVNRMIDCYSELVNSGHITGRCKPVLAIMSEIGKIILTPFNFEDTKDGFVILKSNYKYSDRKAYNLSWELPKCAWVDDNGFLCIKYIDGEN